MNWYTDDDVRELKDGAWPSGLLAGFALGVLFTVAVVWGLLNLLAR